MSLLSNFKDISCLPSMTLVTPSYRSGATIEATICNVISQSYPKLDYVIMDGGSDDDTVNIVGKYEEYLFAWTSEKDFGQYDAINKGFATSNGEVMGWINADDMYLPGALVMVGQIFRDFPEVEWISSLRPGGWDADGLFTGTDTRTGFSKSAFMDGYHLDGLRKRSYCIQQESTFWRRSLWNRIGASIPLQYPLAGDYALWSQFFDHAELFGLNYPIGGFRSLEGQRSSDVEKYRAEAMSVMKDNHWIPSSLSIKCSDIAYSFICRSGPFQKSFIEKFGYPYKTITKINPKSLNSGWMISEGKYFV